MAEASRLVAYSPSLSIALVALMSSASELTLVFKWISFAEPKVALRKPTYPAFGVSGAKSLKSVLFSAQELIFPPFRGCLNECCR